MERRIKAKPGDAYSSRTVGSEYIAGGAAMAEYDAPAGANEYGRALDAPVSPGRSTAVIARYAEGGASTPGHVPAAVKGALSNEQGRPLADAGRWSKDVGDDVSSARIVTGAGAEAAAESIGAKAFTVGNRVFFGAGQYDPGSASGQKLLAHELTHVAQQKDAHIPDYDSLKVSSPGDSIEHEARAHSDGHGAHAPHGGGGAVLARDPDPKADVLPAAVNVTWMGDPFQITFARSKTDMERFMFRVKYTGTLKTDGPSIKDNTKELGVGIGPAPLKAVMTAQDGKSVTVDLYGDGTRIAKLVDEHEVDVGLYKGRRHSLSAKMNGVSQWGGSLWVLDDKVKEDPDAGKPKPQEDVPGENPISRVTDKGTEIRIDADGDQSKELLLYIKGDKEEWSPGVPKSATLTIIQIASGKSQVAKLIMPDGSKGGPLFPIVKEVTDGKAPTRISLVTPIDRLFLTIDPPTRDATSVTYQFHGPGGNFPVALPADGGPKKIVSADGPTTFIGGIWSTDVKLGAYGDTFRLTVQAEGDRGLFGISAVYKGKPIDGMSAPLPAGATTLTALAGDGISAPFDLNGDGKADITLYDQLTTPADYDGGGPPESNRNHNIRVVGPGIGEKIFYFKVRGNYLSGGYATPSEKDQQAASNAAAIDGLKDQAGAGDFQGNIDAYEGAMMAERKKAADEGLIPKPMYEAWSGLSQNLIVLNAQVKGKKVDPARRDTAAGQAQALYTSLKTATAGKDEVVSASEAGATYYNKYTDEMWTVAAFYSHSSGAGPEISGNIKGEQWAKANANYHKLAAGLDTWIADSWAAKKGKNSPEAQRAAFLGAMKRELGAIEGKNPTRLQAVFHPDDKYKSTGKIFEVPLALYYWKEGSKWHLKDLTNPNSTFEDTAPAKEGEKEPPLSLYKELDYKIHFPKGIIHYQVPGGSGGQLKTTEQRTWSEWLTYIGLGIAAVGLTLATFGTGWVAVAGTAALAVSGVVGAAGAGMDMYERASHGALTADQAILDVAQIVANLAGAAALSSGRILGGALKAAEAGEAWTGMAAKLAGLSGRLFVPATAASIGGNAVTLAVMTDQTAKELDAIESSGAPEDEKRRAKALLLVQFAGMAGLIALSIKGEIPNLARGKSLYLYVPKKGGPVVAAATEKAGDIHFSQATVSAKTSDGIPMDELIKSMKTGGWKGDPIDVVKIKGEMVSVDNRRLYAARAAGIEAPVTVHNAADLLPPDQVGRFKLNGEIRKLPDGRLIAGGSEGEVVFKKGAVAKTWEEAILFRTANQGELTGVDFPLMGSKEVPFITEKPLKTKDLDKGPKISDANDVARIQTKGILGEIQDGNVPKDYFAKKSADGKTTLGEWYKKWIESPDPVDMTGAKPKAKYPAGMPEEFKADIDFIVEKGNVTLSLKAKAGAAKLREIHDLKTIDPNKPEYAVARSELVEKYGEEAIKRYESAILGGRGTVGREDVFKQVDKVLDQKGIDTIRGWLPEQEVYVTGSASQPGKAITDIKDVDILIIVPDGTTAKAIAELEAKAGSLVVPTSKEFAAATGRGHLRVDATVRTRSNAFGLITADPGGRTPLNYARIDAHVPTNAEMAHGFEAAKAASGAHTSEKIPPATVQALTNELPGLKIDPANPAAGITDYLTAELHAKPGEIVVKELGGGASGALVYKVTKNTGETIGIFKIFRDKEEMLREIAALKRIRDAGLKIMRPVGIDHAANTTGGAKGPTGGALMTAAEGTFVKDSLKATGAMTNASERAAAMTGLKKNVRQVAKGMAEMHDAMSAGRSVDAKFKDNDIFWLDDKWKAATATKTLATDDIVKIEAGLTKLKDEFRKADMGATVVHGDAHVGNFAVEKTGTVDVIDTETLFRSVGADGKGVAPAATDVGRFYESINVQGVAAGLKPDEIAELQKEFLKTYKAASKTGGAGDIDVAIKFYQVNYDLIHLRTAAFDAAAKKTAIDPAALARVKANLGVH